MSVEVRREGAAAIVVLRREDKRNALSSELVRHLVDAAAHVASDDDVRGVVLTAEGGVFAAGGDLDEFASLLEASDAASRVLEMGDRLRALERLDVPMIAAVAGDVFGGGCELLLLCDLVYAEAPVRFGFRHAAMGLSPAWGGGSRLVERVGPMRAARLLYAAETIDAAEAERIGFITEVTPRGAALARAIEFVARTSRCDRAAVAAQKRMLGSLLEEMRGGSERREADAFKALWGGPPHRRAMQRFAASRKST